MYPRCSCCPFGYHIDLDFVNYCQSLGNVDPSPGQKLRRDRRRQRQSMEIMLGLGPIFQQMDTLQMLPKVGEVCMYKYLYAEEEDAAVVLVAEFLVN